jgi:hypothetical protein
MGTQKVDCMTQNGTCCICGKFTLIREVKGQKDICYSCHQKSIHRKKEKNNEYLTQIAKTAGISPHQLKHISKMLLTQVLTNETDTEVGWLTNQPPLSHGLNQQ